MKKTSGFALLLAAITFSTATAFTPTAWAAETQTMADLHEPYFETLTGRATGFEQPLVADQPLPHGIQLSFPKHKAPINPPYERRSFNLNGWTVYSIDSFDRPQITWSTAYGLTASPSPVNQAIWVTVHYPDGSSEEISAHASIEPSYEASFRGRLQYPSVWLAENHVSTAQVINLDELDLPEGTRFQAAPEVSSLDLFDFSVDETTGTITVSPLSAYWDASYRPARAYLWAKFPDGSQEMLDVSFKVIEPVRPEPKPEPTPKPEPVPTLPKDEDVFGTPPSDNDRVFGSSSS